MTKLKVKSDQWLLVFNLINMDFYLININTCKYGS